MTFSEMLGSSKSNDCAVPVVCGIGIFRYPVSCFSSRCSCPIAQRTLLLVLNNPCGVDGFGVTIRNHPLNVTVRGEHLEKLNLRARQT